MTAAQRQRKRRDKLRDEARRQLIEAKQAAGIGTYRPPKGFAEAREKLINQGHHFLRARREFGAEQGLFLDGAYVSTREVIALVGLPMAERRQWLADQRQRWKDYAASEVMTYMDWLRVSLDELIRYDLTCKEQHARMSERALAYRFSDAKEKGPGQGTGPSCS